VDERPWVAVAPRRLAQVVAVAAREGERFELGLDIRQLL
jgi:hypothetical protein